MNLHLFSQKEQNVKWLNMKTAQIKNFVLNSVAFGLNVLVEMLHLHSFLKINSRFIHQPILAFVKNSFMHLADPEGI